MHLCHKGRIAKGNTTRALLPLFLMSYSALTFPRIIFPTHFLFFFPVFPCCCHYFKCFFPPCFSLILIKLLHHFFPSLLSSFASLLSLWVLYIWLPFSPSIPSPGRQRYPLLLPPVLSFVSLPPFHNHRLPTTPRSLPPFFFPPLLLSFSCCCVSECPYTRSSCSSSRGRRRRLALSLSRH